jgi:long-chain acyl-CoA synthetase
MEALEVSCRPTMSVQNAEALLEQDERFATENIIVRGRVVRAWSTGPKTILDIFSLTGQWPEKPFLLYDDLCTTFGDFRRAVYACARRLADAGVTPGTRVALLMRNRAEWPVAFFATMLTGAIAVPINGWDSDEKIVLMMSDAGAEYLVADQFRYAPRSVPSDHIWTLDGLGKPLSELIPPPPQWKDLPAVGSFETALDPDAVGAIFYTSGTTGRPKGATVTHRAMAAALRNSEYNKARYAVRYPQSVPPIASQTVALFPVPLFHVTAAIAGLVVFAAIGAKLVLMHKWDPEKALTIVERERVTLLGGVPTLPIQLLQSPNIDSYDISSLTDFLYGGAPAPSSLPHDISARFHARSANGWGMTETASTFLLNSGFDYLAQPRSCGLPVPVNEVRVADETGAALPLGQPGELQVRGLTVTRGYWNGQGDDRAFTTDGWLHTGDYATIDEEGFVTIVDRIKDVIIRGGENICTVEIEDMISTHPAVTEASVFARPHPTLGEEAVAIVVFKEPSELTAADLLAFLSTKLPRQKVPADIVQSHAPLPRNAAGKVLKADLKRSYLEALQDRVAARPIS